MSHFSKKLYSLALLGLFSFSIASTAFAASDSENSVTGFFRRLFNYPVKATQKTGEMTEAAAGKITVGNGASDLESIGDFQSTNQNSL